MPAVWIVFLRRLVGGVEDFDAVQTVRDQVLNHKFGQAGAGVGRVNAQAHLPRAHHIFARRLLSPIAKEISCACHLTLQACQWLERCAHRGRMNSRRLINSLLLSHALNLLPLKVPRCLVGKDYTLFALTEGRVKYHRYGRNRKQVSVVPHAE